MKKLKSVILLSNGNTFAADENGEQLPEYQIGWFRLYLDFLKEKNIDVTGVTFDFEHRIFKPFVTKDGNFNWEIK